MSETVEGLYDRQGPLDRLEVKPLHMTEIQFGCDQRADGVRIWWWQAALDEVRRACGACRTQPDWPPNPCWRHDCPSLHRPGDDEMAIGPDCGAGWDCDGSRAVATVALPGYKVGAVCVGCVRSRFGLEQPDEVYARTVTLDRCGVCLGYGLTDTCRRPIGGGSTKPCGGEFGYVVWAVYAVCLACGESASRCDHCGGAAYLDRSMP